MRAAGLPRVSVCLLTYNRGRVLARTIESLLMQTHGDFELIINDDRSPDNTEELCREFEKRDSRVRYFRNSSNLRYANNQNAALLRASSDLVAIVHDGDIYRPDLVEKWTIALTSFPTAAIVFNALEQMDRSGQVVRVHRHSYPALVPGLQLFDEMITSPSSPIFGIVMVRKPFLLSVGPFDPRLPTLADVDMWLRLLLRYDAAYISEPLLRVAPREPNHPNNEANWRVRQEYELIYLLNSARRYSQDVQKLAALRAAISRFIWSARIRALLFCIWHRRITALTEGLSFIARNLNFAAKTVHDSVISWEEAKRFS